MLRFSDGETFDPTGAHRIERRSDGYYVLGGNMMFAVDTYEEGIERIREMNANAEVVLKWDEKQKASEKPFLEVGKKYKVMKEGGRISWWISRSGYQEGAGESFSMGDVITYVGRMTVGGSDPGPSCPAFEGKTGRGIFWPNDWGSIDESFFQKLGN